jgi:hypothetical protein
MAIVGPGETRIAGASAFFEESAVGLRPGPAVIEAKLDRLMGRAVLQWELAKSSMPEGPAFPGRSKGGDAVG